MDNYDDHSDHDHAEFVFGTVCLPPRVVEEYDVQRYPQQQLLGLSKNGRSCEVCGEHMHNHTWADLDTNGFVVACSTTIDAPNN